MTVNEQQMERVPKSDLREIAQHSQNKPSPKLQPMPSNNQNMRIIQPMQTGVFVERNYVN